MDTPERKKRNRGRGEGSITRRKDGRWQGAYTHRAKRHYIYGKTRREVADRLADTLRDIRTGVYVERDPTTVAAFMRRWLSDVKRPVLRLSSYTGYEREIRLRVEPSELGKMRLQDVKADHVQAFLAECGDAGLSPRSVALIYSIVRQAFGQAERWSLVQRNVAALVGPPRVNRYHAGTLSGEQARALLRAVQGHRWHALLVLALSTGMRRGELLALRWADVDLDGGHVTVRATMNRIDGALRLDTTKSDRIRRISPPPAVIAALREHRRAMSAERIQPPTAHVFTTTAGRPVEPQALHRWYKSALRSAGLHDIRFHDLRHSVATILLEAGVHPRVVMEILGHSQISITMDTYSHVMPHVQRDGLSRMEDVLFGS
jgi:integrase